jgi:hypothetical protein
MNISDLAVRFLCFYFTPFLQKNNRRFQWMPDTAAANPDHFPPAARIGRFRAGSATSPGGIPPVLGSKHEYSGTFLNFFTGFPHRAG